MPAALNSLRLGILLHALTWSKRSLEEAAELDSLRPGILPLEEPAELDGLCLRLLPLVLAPPLLSRRAMPAALNSLRPGTLSHVLTWPLPLTSTRTRCWSGLRTPSFGTNCQGTGSSLTALSGTSRIVTALLRAN